MRKVIILFLVVINTLSFAQQNIQVVIQKGHLAAITHIEFSSDNRFLLSVDEQNQLIIWDVKSGKQFASSSTYCGNSTCKFVPNQNAIVIPTASNQLSIWNYEDDTIQSSYKVNREIYDYTFSENEILVATSENFISINRIKNTSQKISNSVYSRIERGQKNKITICIEKTSRRLIELDSMLMPLNRTNAFYIDQSQKLFVGERARIDDQSIKIDAENRSIHFYFLNSVFSVNTESGEYYTQRYTDYFDINCTAVAHGKKTETLIYGTSDNCIFVYNEKTKKSKPLRDVHLSSITDLCFSTNDELFASASKDQSIIIWDRAKLIQLHRLKLTSLPLYSIASNNSGTAIIAGNSMGEIKMLPIVSNHSAITVQNFVAHTEIVSDLYFGDSLIISSSFDNTISKINLKSGELQQGKIKKSGLQFNIVQPDDLKRSLAERKYNIIHSIIYDERSELIGIIYSNNNDLQLSFYNVKTNNYISSEYEINEDVLNHYFKLIENYNNQSSFPIQFTILSNRDSKSWSERDLFIQMNNTFVLNNKNGQLQKLPVGKNKQGNKTLLTTKKNVSVFAYLKSESIVAYSHQSELYIFNLEGEDTYVGNHQGLITDIEFIPKTNLVATSSLDGTVKLWNYITKKESCTIIPVHRNQVIFITPDNYYFSMNNAIDEIGFKIGANFYPAEQFDLKFNRPDLVLESLGCKDTFMISAYKMAYQKRLKKSGFTIEMLQGDFQVPELTIKNLHEIPLITNTNQLAVSLAILDAKYKLDRINVWVNDVAIYGTAGINLREKQTQTYQSNLNIPLAFGKNKIQVSVLNQAGIESYKETVEIECTTGKIEPDLYIVTIGVSNYKDNRYKLTYASKDANDMANAFQKNSYYTNVFTKTLTDQEVTLENLKSIKIFLAQADINDQVILFIAGHGVLDANFDYYFASYDMDFQNPSARGIPYETIEALLDGIKPLKKLLFMDTCHSGEVDKDDIQVADISNSEENGDVTFRNVGVAVENKENQLGLQNTSELMKSLFTDLRKGTGATVVSSAGGVEFAMESDLWKNGLFTFCLLEGIKTKKADLNKDGKIMLSELQRYVGEKVVTLSNGRQQPTSRIENNSIDYRIW